MFKCALLVSPLLPPPTTRSLEETDITLKILNFKCPNLNSHLTPIVGPYILVHEGSAIVDNKCCSKIINSLHRYCLIIFVHD
jgi:hypothetical protein